MRGANSTNIIFKISVRAFALVTSWPTLTENWEEESKKFWNGTGWTWVRFSEEILKREKSLITSAKYKTYLEIRKLS